jgi:UDP-N-acetylmuramate dehydrogenase
VKLAAGWLIEQAGWKGKRVGNAGMHAKQALVLVNYGGATAAELVHVATQVQADVLAKFGVALEMEVNLIGG